MNKKRPEIFIGKINKRIYNNRAVFYSGKDNDEKNSLSLYNDLSIKEQINKMFDSKEYVYKVNATILTKDGKVSNKEVIGKINNSLVTIDEEYIPISNILKIQY